MAAEPTITRLQDLYDVDVSAIADGKVPQWDAAASKHKYVNSWSSTFVQAPTGVAGTDSAAIQAAIDALPAAGGEVYLQRGTYALGTTTITFPVNKAVHLIGQGKDATTLTYSGASYAIDLVGTGLGSALPYTSAVRDCIVRGMAIAGPLDGTGLGGIRLNRTFHCTLEDLHITGFTKSTSVFGAAIYMTACFYNVIRKVQTWPTNGGTTQQNFYGIRMDNAQDATPPFFNLISDCSFYRCDRGAEVAGNGNVFLQCAFEQCGNFGVTSSQGVNNAFIKCWFEGINTGSATGLRLGTTGGTVVGYLVRDCRFSTNVTTCIQVFAKRSQILHNVFKPGYTTAISESTASANNLYEDNFIDDASGTALDVGAGITLLAGSKSKVVATGSPKGASAITVTASPFTYSNADGHGEMVYIDGGTVSSIAKNSVTLRTSTNAEVWLEPGESVIVTYTVAPTMSKDEK